MAVTMVSFLLFLVASFSASLSIEWLPGGIENLKDPSQHIHFIWENLVKVNEVIGKNVVGRLIWVPGQVEKGTFQSVGGSIYTWQIVFYRAYCDIDKPSKETCRPYAGIDAGIGQRFFVTLRMIVSTNFTKEWTASPALSDDEIQLWKDIEMINVELPGNNLYYYIPGRIYMAYDSGKNERKYRLSMMLTACRKAKDIPTMENCPPLRTEDGSGIKFYDLTRVEDKGAVHFVGYSAVETPAIVN